MVVVGNHNLIAGAPMATDRRINTFTTRFIGIIRMLYEIKWYDQNPKRWESTSTKRLTKQLFA